MHHTFDVEFATEYGMVEAILFSYLEHWIKKNKANNKNFFDGRYWTYNSIKAWCEIFPYLSAARIRNALKNLEAEGLILTGNYNKSAYDRTLWYTFSDKATSILTKWQMEVCEKSNQNSQNSEPIPVKVPDRVPSNTPYNPPREKKSKNDNSQVIVPLKKETGFSDQLQEKFEEWVEYKKSEKKKPYKAIGLKNLVSEIRDYSKRYGDSIVIKVMQSSMSAGYQGIVWDWLEKEKSKEHARNEPF